MLMVSHASHQHQRIAQALSTLEQPLDIVFKINSGPLGALFIDGMGNAILDPISASAHENTKSVVIRPCEPATRYDLWVIYPAKQPRSEGFRGIGRR